MSNNAELRLLYAWDLGASNGHIARLLSLHPDLSKQGFYTYAAVNRVREYGHRLAKKGIPVLQSPVSEPSTKTRLKPISLAHIFHNRGYAQADELLGMVEGWRSLMSLTGASLVLADAAPAALIAARTLGLPVVNLSTAFHVPPPVSSFTYFPGATPEGDSLTHLEAKLDSALAEINTHYGAHLPARFVELFSVENPGFFDFPEFDPYAELRAPGHSHHGPLIDIHGGAPFVWPQGADKTAPRIFVYLQANTPGTRNLLHALANLGWPAVVCCPGFTREPDLLRLSKEKSSLVLHEHLLDIHQARSQADFGVGNGSAGFISAFLLGGLPLLLVPYDSEKNLNAQRLATLGAGLVVLPIEGAASCISALQNMRNNQAIRRAALAFAARYAAHSTAEITATFARQCREIAL